MIIIVLFVFWWTADPSLPIVTYYIIILIDNQILDNLKIK